MGTFCLESKNKMKAVFASALVAAATALPWEDSQRAMKWSEPSIEYGIRGVSYDVSIPSNAQTSGNPTSWPIAGEDYKCYNWGPGRGYCRVLVDGRWKYTKWGENGDSGSEAASTSQLNEFCKYWSVYRPAGEGSSALEQNVLSDQNGQAWATGPNDNQWDAVQSATKSTFCKACFGGDDVQTTTKFCKACFGGDVEVQTKFCKACFGGDDAETTARFCKSCFGGDVESTARFCKACFGGDDAEVKARFCKSCFGGDDVETTARFCKSCFGGDDAEVHSRFCKSCFGGDVEARVKCDCSNKESTNHYGLGLHWAMLKELMSKEYSILATAHELGVDPDACECALGTDSTTKHYLPGGGLAYDKYMVSTHSLVINSFPSIMY